VDEWTSAETGVGAAIAAGSHLENGICALFVIAATVMQKICMTDILESHIFMIYQCPWLSVHAIDNNSMTSPIRLVRAVIIPAARDLGF
jgi:hypothetical protein